MYCTFAASQELRVLRFEAGLHMCLRCVRLLEARNEKHSLECADARRTSAGEVKATPLAVRGVGRSARGDGGRAARRVAERTAHRRRV